jgi:hypothetical protein
MPSTPKERLHQFLLGMEQEVRTKEFDDMMHSVISEITKMRAERYAPPWKLQLMDNVRKYEEQGAVTEEIVRDGVAPGERATVRPGSPPLSGQPNYTTSRGETQATNVVVYNPLLSE